MLAQQPVVFSHDHEEIQLKYSSSILAIQTKEFSLI
jgi:hypothetical protein